jgi:hypothetical protein
MGASSVYGIAPRDRHVDDHTAGIVRMTLIIVRMDSAATSLLPVE